MPIRLVLADDHYLIREGVAALSGTTAAPIREIECCGVTATARTVRRS